ncbi:uncharacterized protein LOC110430986 [Sorghum bicolor]|uniref:VWFA domain-containing protein n=1 Tax=Sorghum bicolor TaxID=4558 RepID=A0A1W0VR56_SORBI|nr:uncharacterized protein LOC110430986 [Sorghum bicolor]OQU75754.1 hypothetical protein SORBI_3010G023500 [Sorghum bicolor]|eukprot:XP_021305016.1 uncharacterized protein LOC110430986 [Sorghum bicolor]
MVTNIRLFHAKKMHTTSRVLPVPMTWLVFTLLLSSVAAAAETVKVITTPVFAQIPRFQSSKDFQVLVRVEAPPAAQQQRRVPIDLAVVLDVGTGPVRLDAVKKAVKFIIRQIHDDDRVAVVGPSSNSRLVTGFLSTRDARRDAENSVDELEPRGEFTSGAGAGLEEAIKILRELPATESRSSRARARFIILVTDAATTEASNRFSKLPREDLPPVHTLGLGAAYDPRALLYIASESQGTYSFVDDDDTDGITGAIAVCLSGLKDVVAVGTRVRVEAPLGITIERIDSGGYMTSPVTRDEKASGEVAVGVLYAGEVKSFIVHLSVPALPSTTTAMTSLDGGCDKQQLLTTSFIGHYTTSDEEDAAGAAPASPSPTVTQAILYVQRPPPEAMDGTLQRVPVPVVMNHIARFDLLEMVTTFVNKEIGRLTSSNTVEVAAKLRIQWEQFVQARQFWSGLDLGVLDVEVNRMVSILEEPAGRGRTRSGSSSTAYMLSWLSSYQMQRPTAMGSPGSVAAAFVTVNMQLMLQQATIVTTGAPLCVDGGCPACECRCEEERCVQPLPPPVLVPSGRGDDTFRVNPVYPQDVLFNAINQAMKHMYLALVQASNLTRCDAAAGLEVLPA